MISVPVGMGDLLATPWQEISLPTILGTIYVVVFVTFLTYGLNAWALKRVPASQVGAYIYLQPVLVAIITPLLYPNVLTLEKLLYMAVVLTGVFLVNKPQKMKNNR